MKTINVETTVSYVSYAFSAVMSFVASFAAPALFVAAVA